MKYIVYNSACEADFTTAQHQTVIDSYIADYKKNSVVNPKLTCSNKIDLELANFDYEDLSKMHFHYSHKNNGASIERTGLVSSIGDNSQDIDDKEAIYFSVGLEAVLHNWDVWLKWRLNRFCNPNAAGVHCNKAVGSNFSKMVVAWMKYLASKEYRNNEALLESTFEYERIELSRSDYYALAITPGIDYPRMQFDEKKAFIAGSKYAEEIYGVGVSTCLGNNYAEQWNRHTEPGKRACITSNKIRRLTAIGNDDALSVLQYLYRKYLEHCDQTDTEPAAFALLPKFLTYCSTR